MTGAADSGFTMRMDPKSAARLREQVAAFPAELSGKLSEKLTDVGDEIVKAMQAKIMQAPRSAGRNDRTAEHHSRQQTAAGITAKVTETAKGASLTVEATTAQMAPQHTAFPFVYNLSRITHPVFGHRNAGFVTQSGNPYFDAAAKPLESDDIPRQLDDGVQAAADTVKGSR